MILAGGLNPDNIVEAIQTVQPFGVDICSGVRTNHRLDEAKLAKFFANLHSVNDPKNRSQTPNDKSENNNNSNHHC